MVGNPHTHPLSRKHRLTRSPFLIQVVIHIHTHQRRHVLHLVLCRSDRPAANIHTGRHMPPLVPKRHPVHQHLRIAKPRTPHHVDVILHVIADEVAHEPTYVLHIILAVHCMLTFPHFHTEVHRLLKPRHIRPAQSHLHIPRHRHRHLRTDTRRSSRHPHIPSLPRLPLLSISHTKICSQHQYQQSPIPPHILVTINCQIHKS